MSKFFRFFILLLAVMAVGCTEYQKVMKSDDYELKYETAQKYYNEEDYARALTLLENIRSIYRGTDQSAKIDYMIANSYFEQGNYILAGYHFRNMSETYPNSEYTKEAYYMSAYCSYLESPRPSLDQSSTHRAIEEFQLFISKYPQDEKVDLCNTYITELRDKLEEKAYKAARFYFDLDDYKAASVALRNALRKYPDTDYRESLLYLTFKSDFLLAKNSVKSKKAERYEKAIKSYYPLVDEFPGTEHKSEVKKLFSEAQESLENIREKQDNPLSVN